MIGGSSRSTVWVLLGLVACGATPQEDRANAPVGCWADGETPGTGAWVGATPSAERSCRKLGRSLSRVREHFEAGRGRTRIVALLDHRLQGLETLRPLLTLADAGEVRLTVIWDEKPRDEDWAAGLPDDDRVAAFVDRRRVAGRVFARGLLPTACAQELYLVYGPEARWPENSDGAASDTRAGMPPAPLVWWHRMGRLAPAHRVADLEELGEQLSGAIVSRPVGR